MLWIDYHDSIKKIESIRHPVVKQAVIELCTEGFTVLEQVIPSALCDAAIEDFDKFCNEHVEESKQAMQKEGFRSRLYNLHNIGPACKAVALAPLVLAVLDHIFSQRAALNSTLFFEQSSQQHTHRDTPFFTADPYPGEFAGVWFAFEDVHEDSGPLSYVPGAHKFEVNISEAREAGNSDPSLVDTMFLNYNAQIQNYISKNRLKDKLLIIKKGDVAIWHPELPHGGSPICGVKRSRKSMVAHYIPEGAYIQTVGYFFGLEEKRKIMEFMDAGDGRLMRWNEYPIFMPNS